MSLIAAAKPAWDRIVDTVSGALGSGSLVGATFYESPVVPVNLRLPAIVVMERSISPVEEAYTWGIAELRVRMDVLSGYPDPTQNLRHLEAVSDSLLSLFWNDRQMGGTVRDTKIGEVTIGEVEERPEHISASLVLMFTIDFQRPL